MFRIGYNSNGLAHHRPLEALQLLSDLGYGALSVTPDPGWFDPWHLRPTELADLRRCATDLGLELVMETGSRFLLDPQRKHFPTLLEERAGDRSRRIDFLKRCVEMAAEIGAPVVSIWSGAAPSGVVADEQGSSLAPACEAEWSALVQGVHELLDFSSGTGVQLCFEPEPGMFIERPLGFGELQKRLGASGERLGLTLDVGHCLVTGDDAASMIEEWSGQLGNVHLDDIANGVHDHRMFGTGDLDLSGTLAALMAAGFEGVAAVELSRDSHRGAAAAEEALGHIQRALAVGGG